MVNKELCERSTGSGVVVVVVVVMVVAVAVSVKESKAHRDTAQPTKHRKNRLVSARYVDESAQNRYSITNQTIDRDEITATNAHIGGKPRHSSGQSQDGNAENQPRA